jgi:hypothetical protein
MLLYDVRSHKLWQIFCGTQRNTAEHGASWPHVVHLCEALFMHEVPVHVNATMEEEVGQAIDSKGSSALSEVGWAVDGNLHNGCEVC